MYVHLGEDVFVHTDEIIAVLDYQKLKDNETNRAMMTEKEKSGNWVGIGSKTVKSLVVTEAFFYASPFSVATLKRRMQAAIGFPG